MRGGLLRKRDTACRLGDSSKFDSYATCGKTEFMKQYTTAGSPKYHVCDHVTCTREGEIHLIALRKACISHLLMTQHAKDHVMPYPCTHTMYTQARLSEPLFLLKRYTLNYDTSWNKVYGLSADRAIQHESQFNTPMTNERTHEKSIRDQASIELD